MTLFNMLNNKVLGTYVKTQVMASTVVDAARKFKEDQRGVTAVEYAIVIGGVAAVVAVIFNSSDGIVKTMLTNIFSNVQQNVMNNMPSGS